MKKFATAEKSWEIMAKHDRGWSIEICVIKVVNVLKNEKEGKS